MNDGTLVFLCGDGLKDAAVCKECGHLADSLCDFPIGGGKTCDAALCDRHSLLISENTHYCPDHAREYGLFEPITKPCFRKPGDNDNSPYRDPPPQKRRKRLPRRVA